MNIRSIHPNARPGAGFVDELTADWTELFDFREVAPRREADAAVVGVILAGGQGTRLAPLTRNQAKPAVPFGARHRLVDFALSNLINSGVRSVYPS